MSALVVESDGTDRGWVTNFDSFANGTNGLGLIDSANDSAHAFARGDFIEGAINGVAAAIDVVGMVLNPLGGLCSMAINWLLEHCGPIQSWLDDLLGDPAVIKAGAQSWTNIGDHLASLGPELRGLVSADTAGFSGLAIDAYQGSTAVVSSVIEGLAQISHGVSTGIEVAGGLLAGVRTFIEQIFSDLVGNVLGALAQSALTLGIAAPSALGGLIAKAKRVLDRCRQFMEALSTSLAKMADLIAEISPAVSNGSRALATICGEGASLPVTFAVNLGKGAGTADD